MKEQCSDCKQFKEKKLIRMDDEGRKVFADELGKQWKGKKCGPCQNAATRAWKKKVGYKTPNAPASKLSVYKPEYRTCRKCGYKKSTNYFYCDTCYHDMPHLREGSWLDDNYNHIVSNRVGTPRSSVGAFGGRSTRGLRGEG